ncbi:MAG: hypothetical protein NTW52_12085 [Planctomycetota bacterium]|nr:hypothetical protein [Planctomycetota bacterium]
MNQKKQELQSNLLADRMEEFFISLKPYLKWFAAAIVVLVVAGIAFGLRKQTADKIAADSWTEFYFAGGRPDQLDAIAQTYPGTQGALWAQQTGSDSLMARALSSVYLDRNLSDELFTQASKGYQEVLAQTTDPLLTSRATLGLAQALDSQGKSAEALVQYKRLLTTPGVYEGLVEEAKRRIEFIESEDGKAFFTWFQSNRPAAPTPVNVPGNLKNLPGMPDLQFTTPGNTTPLSEMTFQPAPSATALPGTDAPADQASEKPASSEKSATAPEAATPTTDTPSSFSVPSDTPKPQVTTESSPIQSPPTETPSTSPATSPPATSPTAPESGS